MDMPTNKFLRAIEAGQKQLGMWVTLTHNFAAEIVAPAGYDWVVIDMEHAPNDYRSVFGQLQAFAATDTTALVRAEWNDTVVVKRLMDMGVPGIVFPMINSIEEAQNAVAATRYPPNGNRGFAGATRATKFGRITNYAGSVDAQTAVILQIETQRALDIAEDIAAIDGVSGIFFGPADIAADIGYLGQPSHADVWAQIMPVAKTLIAKGVPVGTVVTDLDFAVKLLDEGFAYVACGIDSLILAKGVDDALHYVKDKMKG